ncbi:MAG: hypothetical protein ACK5T6_07140 [Pirellula sp.]
MKYIKHEQQRVSLTQLVEQSNKYWHGVKFVVNSDLFGASRQRTSFVTRQGSKW